MLRSENPTWRYVSRFICGTETVSFIIIVPHANSEWMDGILVPGPLYKSLLESLVRFLPWRLLVSSLQKRLTCPCLACFCHINGAPHYLKSFLSLIPSPFQLSTVWSLTSWRPTLRRDIDDLTSLWLSLCAQDLSLKQLFCFYVSS